MPTPPDSTSATKLADPTALPTPAEQAQQPDTNDVGIQAAAAFQQLQSQQPQDGTAASGGTGEPGDKDAMLERNKRDQAAQDAEQAKAPGVAGTLAGTVEDVGKDVGRGLVNGFNALSDTGYGIMRTVANAAGLWRGHHGRFATAQEVSTENPVQIDQQWATRMLGEPHGRADQMVQGVAQLLPLMAAGNEAGAVKTALGATALTNPADPRLISEKLSKLPIIGPLAAKALKADPDDPWALAELKNTAEQFLTVKAVEGLIGGIKGVYTKLRGSAPAELPASPRAGGVPAEVTANPQGGVRLRIGGRPTPNQPTPADVSALPPQGETTEQMVARQGAVDASNAPPPPEQAAAQAEKPETVKMYRGVAKGQDPLAPGHEGVTFATPDAEYAKKYANKGGEVHQLEFPKPQNPMDIGSMEDTHASMLKEGVPQEKLPDWTDFITKAREAGHDAIRATLGGREEWAFLSQEGARIVPPAEVDLPSNTDAESLGASVQEASRAHADAAEAEAGKELNEHQQKGVVRLAQMLSTESNPSREAVAGLIAGHHLNTPYLASPEVAGRLMDHIAETLKRAQGGFAQSGDQLLATAHEILPQAATAEQALSKVQKVLGGADDWATHLLAAKVYNRIHWRTVEGLAAAADHAPGNTVAAANLASALKHGFAISNLIEKAESGAGRALGTASPWGQALVDRATAQAPEAAQQTAEPFTSGSEGVDNYIRQVRGLPKDAPIGSDDWSALVRQVALSNGDPATIYKAISNAQKIAQAKAVAMAGETIPFGTKQWAQATLRMIPEYFLGSILSGVKTVQRVALGSASNLVMRPLELMQAGLPGGEFGGGWRGFNPALIRRGANTVVQTVKATGDAFEMAAQAFKAGHSLLDPKLGGTVVAPVPEGLGWLHTLLSTPGRLHMAVGEFNRAAGYLGDVGSRSIEQSMQAGLSGDALAKRLSDDLDFSVSPDGAAINKQSLDVASRITNTRQLTKGSIADFLSKYANEHPFARMILPVIKFPANAWLKMTEETPVLASALKSVRDDYAAGGERAAIAQSRQELGAMAIAGASALAYSGLLTGGGPTDPKLRKEWDVNHKPYSIKIGDTWHSYDVFGSLAMVSKAAGTFADYTKDNLGGKVGQQEALDKANPNYHPTTHLMGRAADFVAAMGHVASDEGTNFVSILAAAWAHAVGDASYLHDSITNMSAFLNGDHEAIKRGMESTAASVAVPRIVSDFNFDPVKREVDGMWDKIQSQVPWLSEKLEPARNAMGEPIMYPPAYSDMPNYKLNLFAGMRAGTDPTEEKLLEMGKVLSVPHSTMYANQGQLKIDLKDRDRWAGTDTKRGQSPWDRMGELVNSEQLVGGRTMREAIEDRMATDRWQRYAESDGLVNPDSKAVAEIQDIVNKYYSRARVQVEREYPSLRSAIHGTKSVIRAERSGNADAENEAIQRLLYGGD